MIGKFLGKIKDYGVSESTAGNPQVFISFEFEHDGASKTMSWYGSFAGGAKDITLKTLIYCGLMPQFYNQLVNLKNGIAANMLDLNKVLELDIQEEPSYKDPSKIVSKINWVNDPNSAPQIKKIDEAKNAQFFGTMGFDGDLIRLATEMGISLNNGANATMGANQNMQNTNPHNQQMQNQNQQMNTQQNQGQNQQQNFDQQANNQQMNTQQNQQMNNQQMNNQQTQGQNTNGTFKAPF